MAQKTQRPPLGQHFLRDSHVLERIGSAVEVHAGDIVIEVGPGDGALTAHLLQRGARVTAIEIDSALAARLRQRFADTATLDIVEADILQVDLAALIGERSQEPVAVAGNLPYYITSPIVRQVFAASSRISRAVFLMQKEVALRVTAGKGSRDYGFLSVLCELYAERELLFTVPPGAFRPPPKVTSAVVRLTMRQQGGAPAALLTFLEGCFRQPRKTLLNNLSDRYPRSALAAIACTSHRAQELSLAELRELWRRLGAGS